jgi:predicted N-acetyltransferase YhbS
MPLRPSIRQVDPGDVPALDILRRQAVEAACRGAYDRASFVDIVAETGDDLGDQVADEDYHALVVETEVTPVSYGVLELPVDDAARLRALYTSPDHEGEGYAGSLLERFVERTREAGGDAIRVVAPTVSADYFEDRGFEREDEAEWHGLPAATLVRSV